LDLEVVFPSGEITHLSRPVRKSVAGLDLIRLIVGSEGTLAIVVEALLRIAPLPPFRRILQASFSNLTDLGNCVSGLNQHGLIPSAIEVLDKSAIEAIEKYKENVQFPPNAEAVLLIEEEGDELRYVEFRLQKFQQVCEENEAFEIHISQSEAENTELWEARSLVGAASSRVKAGYDRIYVGEDITVPIDQLARPMRQEQFSK